MDSVVVVAVEEVVVDEGVVEGVGAIAEVDAAMDGGRGGAEDGEGVADGGLGVEPKTGRECRRVGGRGRWSWGEGGCTVEEEGGFDEVERGVSGLGIRRGGRSRRGIGVGGGRWARN